MNTPTVEPLPPEIGSLLASERMIDPEPDEFRMRAVERARAELAYRMRTDSLYPRRISRPRKVSVAVAAAAGVMLVALCAVAFRSVFQSGLKGEIPPGNTWLPGSRISDLQVPAPSEALPEASPAVTPPSERSSKSRVAGRARTANDRETYAIELALLQPAYHAVARRDFTSALAAIAAHQHRFASGQLEEEREALRVRALLGLDRRSEARRAASAFRERFPRSVLLRRIEGMLDSSP